MARALRMERIDGWYHITARGNERRAIYRDPNDRLRFLDLLEGLTDQFGWRIHGYVLMDNHYHLLVRTPRANLSAGMQWLGVSYSVWFNRRHRRVGHLFQGRFHAVVLEETVAVEVSRYVHLNPIRVRRLGLDRTEQQRHRAGLGPAPDPAVLKERIQRLRAYRWSSYRAYIGLQRPPPWLAADGVQKLVGGRRKEFARRYREYVETAVRQGLPESPWERTLAGFLLGSHEFARRMATRLAKHREQPATRRLLAYRGFDEVVRVIEQIKGEPWQEFRDRHADWGRDAVLWLARRHCGMTLRALGQAVGGLDYVTVCTSVRRLDERSHRDRHLASVLRAADRHLQNAKT